MGTAQLIQDRRKKTILESLLILQPYILHSAFWLRGVTGPWIVSHWSHLWGVLCPGPGLTGVPSQGCIPLEERPVFTEYQAMTFLDPLIVLVPFVLFVKFWGRVPYSAMSVQV